MYIINIFMVTIRGVNKLQIQDSNFQAIRTYGRAVNWKMVLWNRNVTGDLRETRVKLNNSDHYVVNTTNIRLIRS